MRSRAAGLPRVITYRVSLAAIVLLCAAKCSTAHEGHKDDAKTPLKKITVVCAERFPDVYMHQDEVHGIQAEFVAAALRRAGFQSRVKILPLKRCLLMMREGNADAMFPVVESEELARHMRFCPDVEKTHEKKGEEKAAVTCRYRILTVDHVVITHADRTTRADEFKGDVKTLPEPVRVLHGEPFITDLKKAGKKVQEVRLDRQNFAKLLREKVGTVIAPSFIAEQMNTDPAYREKLYIHDRPISSRSTHLAFSRKATRISASERKKIWTCLRASARDHVAMNMAFVQATKAASRFK